RLVKEKIFSLRPLAGCSLGFPRRQPPCYASRRTPTRRRADMTLRTLMALLGSRQYRLLPSLLRAADHSHRLAFVGAALSNGLLRRLAAGPVTLDALATELGVVPALRDGLDAWLELGVALGELRAGPKGYTVRGRLSRMLLAPANDAAAALVE